MSGGYPSAKRILVVRYRFIGDTILTVPFLRNVRQAYPDAVIDVLVGPQSGEVLDHCPYVNELIEYDTTRFHKYDSGAGEKKSFWYYVKLLRARHYDTVFVLKRSWSAALLPVLIGAKNRIGYANSARRLLFTKSVPFSADMHEVDSLLTVLECANIPVTERKLEAFVSDEERSRVLPFVKDLAPGETPILIHAAAAHPDKMYPIERWAEVLKLLKEKLNFVPYFTGAPRDKELYDELCEKSGIQGRNLAGQLSLRESMALYKEMKLALCVDSGPAHLAAAVGTPTVALFGPTDPNRWGPYGKNNIALYDESLQCRPCHYNKTCANRECLTQFDAERVVNAGLQLLNNV